jgi:hypothetical protein
VDRGVHPLLLEVDEDQVVHQPAQERLARHRLAGLRAEMFLPLRERAPHFDELLEGDERDGREVGGAEPEVPRPPRPEREPDPDGELAEDDVSDVADVDGDHQVREKRAHLDPGKRERAPEA